MATIEDIYNLIRIDNDGAKAILERYNVPVLESALDRLSEPIRLSFAQRMMAKAFNLDIPGEINRFTRLLQETIVKKGGVDELLVLKEPVPLVEFQQNLK